MRRRKSGGAGLRAEALEVRALMASLPAGFTESPVATGLSNPTAMEFSPGGDLFVAEQAGTMGVFRDGVRVQADFFRDSPIRADSSGERGLLGVAFDPNFATNRYVYAYYTATSPRVHNRLSRFTADATGTLALAGSEAVLLDIDPLSSATNHNGGAVHFGPDGKLYVAVGDNADGANSQSLGTLKGKILRLNPDGSIPSDNPFDATATGVNRAIWALGLRNPYTFSFQPGTGRMFINDVGASSFEEINEGRAGDNYGWPTDEGPAPGSRFVGPFYSYSHAVGQAITGGAFYNAQNTRFPADYTGDYFFADFVAGTIRRIDPATKQVADFASNAAGPVDLRVDGNGFLYYLSRGEGKVYRVDTSNTPPSPARVTLATDPAGLPLTVDGRVLAAPFVLEGRAGETHQVAAPSVTIGGATYAFVGWSDDGGASHSITLSSGESTLTARFVLASARVNFQPGTAPIPASYTADAGRLFGERRDGLKFGWNWRNLATAKARRVSNSPGPQYSTFQVVRGRAARWEIAVPNGRYLVRIVAGDPSQGGRKISLDAEGHAVTARTNRARPWADRTIAVSVTDGRLTIRGKGNVFSPVNFVEVRRAIQ